MEISDHPFHRDLTTRALEIDAMAERGDPEAPARAAALLAESDDLGLPHEVAAIVTALCERVLALDRVRAGRTGEADRHIRRALAASGDADPATQGRVHLTAMSVAASAGRTAEALRHADLGAPLLSGEHRIRLDIQRASVLQAANRFVDAYRAFHRVLEDHPELGGFTGGVLRLNLGTVAVSLGHVTEGIVHLREAKLVFQSLSNEDHASIAAIHAARAAAQVGDFSTVFEIHAEIGADQTALTAQTLVDIADCLIAAGLLDEADGRLRSAIALYGDSISIHRVYAELSLGQLLARRGDPDASAVLDTVREHARLLDDDTLHSLATIDLAATAVERVPDGELLTAIETCRSAGLELEAIEGEIVFMQRQLDRSATAFKTDFDPPSITGSNLRRAQAHHHRALTALGRGDQGAARASLAHGLRAIDRSRAAIGADELRASASDRAPELARLGLRAALASGRAATVFDWAERARATSLRLAQPTSTDDPELDADLAALREAAPSSAEAEAAERRVIERRRTNRADATVATATKLAEVRSQLRPDEVLLEYVDVDGRLFLVEVRQRRTAMSELDVTTDELADMVGKLQFGLRRMSGTTGPAIAGAIAMVDALGQRLADTLIPTHVVESNVAIVPTGPLHQLPWAALPSLADRAVTIVPSAHVWHRAAGEPAHTNAALVATGPGLLHADEEARSVAEMWGVEHLSMATSPQIGRSLPGTDIVHLCCHGRFRADNPQFSALDLADGPFTIIDLDNSVRLPSLVVLSACNVGAVDVRASDDVLGFPSTLLARGVRTLVAATLPIEDRAAGELAVALHQELAEGRPAATALSRARQTVRGRSPAHAAAAASMSCFGAG